MDQQNDRMATHALDQDGFGASYAPPAQQHLVVETRTDDRWRVMMCTTLDQLDDALDLARSLRREPDIDEVCLTLETTGSHGREARREIIRFGHDGAPENFKVATGRREQPVMPEPTQEATPGIQPQVSQAAYYQTPVAPPLAGDMDPLLQSIKAPDYEVDEAILEALRPAHIPMPPAAPPMHVPSGGPSETEARQAARQLVQSLYGLSDETDDVPAVPAEPVRILTKEEVIDFAEIQQMSDDMKRERRLEAERDAAAVAESQAASVPGPDVSADWVSDTDTNGGHGEHRLEAEAQSRQKMSAAERLERPLVGDPSGTATKAFIVAGTLAMMVLGGALAELLAVDLTSSAMADQVPSITVER